jgi:uncharacterized protein YndB with AHSA1/START domain
MTTPSESPTKAAPGHLLLTRVFNAPRALVFRAWVDPVHLAQWWGPHGFTNPRCELDARPGGTIRVDMRGPNGIVYPMTGTYREIDEPDRLVFVAGALNEQGETMFEILNTVTFVEHEGRTTLTLETRVLEQGTEAPRYLSGHAKGWGQSIERFAEFLAKVQGPDAAPEREIVTSRVFDAPRELVWEAMTSPEHVIHWWGPRGFTTTIDEMDVRPGGVWRHTMHGPDGVDYPNLSVFKEVVKPERIVLANSGGKQGEPVHSFEKIWTFEAINEQKTRTTIRLVFPTAQEREMVAMQFKAIEGGRQTLERLAEQLAKSPLVIERVFDAPADLVWKAISERDRMKIWYFELAQFAPEPGFEFEFSVEHDGTNYQHLCQVKEVVAGKKLAYTWRYAGQPGDSLVTFALFPEGEKTRLRLTHEGLDTFPKLPAYARHNFVRGWTMLIGSELKNYLALPG